MTKYEEGVFSEVISLVREWQLNGHQGICLPVLRNNLLDELCGIANDKASDSCNICHGLKTVSDGYEDYRCVHCQLVPD